MDNVELMTAIEEILAEDNFCNLLEKLVSFEKEYKTSEFYSKTKLKLFDFVEYYKKFNPIPIKKIFAEIQREISHLDLSNLDALLNNFSEMLNIENQNLMDIIKKIDSSAVGEVLKTLA